MINISKFIAIGSLLLFGANATSDLPEWIKLGLKDFYDIQNDVALCKMDCENIKDDYLDFFDEGASVCTPNYFPRDHDNEVSCYYKADYATLLKTYYKEVKEIIRWDHEIEEIEDSEYKWDNEYEYGHNYAETEKIHKITVKLEIEYECMEVCPGKEWPTEKPTKSPTSWKKSTTTWAPKETKKPTPSPTWPTPQPTWPTAKPTTPKPTHKPTPKPTGSPTSKPTWPSAKPTKYSTTAEPTPAPTKIKTPEPIVPGTTKSMWEKTTKAPTMWEKETPAPTAWKKETEKPTMWGKATLAPTSRKCKYKHPECEYGYLCVKENEHSEYGICKKEKKENEY